MITLEKQVKAAGSFDSKCWMKLGQVSNLEAKRSFLWQSPSYITIMSVDSLRSLYSRVQFDLGDRIFLGATPAVHWLSFSSDRRARWAVSSDTSGDVLLLADWPYSAEDEPIHTGKQRQIPRLLEQESTGMVHSIMFSYSLPILLWLVSKAPSAERGRRMAAEREGRWQRSKQLLKLWVIRCASRDWLSMIPSTERRLRVWSHSVMMKRRWGQEMSRSYWTNRGKRSRRSPFQSPYSRWSMTLLCEFFSGESNSIRRWGMLQPW